MNSRGESESRKRHVRIASRKICNHPDRVPLELSGRTRELERLAVELYANMADRNRLQS
jgi:hypothetical protein